MDVAAFLPVMVMITHGASGSLSPLTSTYCEGKNESSHCLNCMSPVYCDGEGGIIEYGSCPQGEACAVRYDASYCTAHTETPCACIAAGAQCDAYDLSSIEHCLNTGPVIVDACPDGEYCYDGECMTAPACVPDDWSILKPDCTIAVFCDENGKIIEYISCSAGEYVNSEYECFPAPPPVCDGSCIGRCPNPIDCSKFVVCDHTTEIGSGDCPAGTFFDTEINNCASSSENCIATDGCAIRVITTTTETTSTTTTEQPTTTTYPETTTIEVPTTTTYPETTTTF